MKQKYKNLVALALGVSLCLLSGCPSRPGSDELNADKGVGKETQTVAAKVASKTSASAQTIKEHAEEPEIVMQFAERIITLQGAATLEDIQECKKLLTLSKEKWAKQLETDAKLADKNRQLHAKLNAVASRLDILAAEAEERRKDDQLAPFRRALYFALGFLLYYAVVKKDPIQSALCATIAIFCGGAPWLYDSAAFGYLIWIICAGLGVYFVVIFYDIIKTRITAKHAVAVAEKLKDTKPEDTEAVLKEVGETMNPIAKAGIREAKVALGIAQKETPRVFGMFTKLFS